MPRKIAKQVTLSEKQQDADIAYGDWQWHFYKQQGGQPKLVHQLTFPGKQYDDFLLQLLMDNWRPPHAHLLRREAAAHLQSISAWNPTTTACTDREYYTLAALEGFKFRYVADAAVFYNSGLGPQVTRSTPYAKRIDNLKRMFQRFQNRKNATINLEPAHQFLLTQNWELWQPSFSQINMSEEGFWLQHNRS